MKAELVLAEKQIAVAPLQRSLKLLGYDIHKLPLTLDTTPNELLDVLRELSGIDLSKASRQEKIVWQTKLRKFDSLHVKAMPTNLQAEPVIGQIRENGVSLTDLKRKLEHREPKSFDAFNLGVVKFVADDLSHGFVIPFKNPGEVYHRDFLRKAGSRIPQHEVSAGLAKNDLVAFTLNAGFAKPEARKLQKQLPVFIVNRDGASYSTAYLLLEQYWEKGIRISQQQEEGFATLSLSASGTLGNWHVANWNKGCHEGLLRHFGTLMFQKFVLSGKDSKGELALLSTTLSTALNQSELQGVYSRIVQALTQKTIAEIYDAVDEIETLDFFPQIISNCSGSLNKISFVLWAKALLPQLPAAKSQKEANIWCNEIVPSLDSIRLLQVLQKLCQENGNLEQVSKSYQYLLSKGITIGSYSALEQITEALKVLTAVFPKELLHENYFVADRPEWMVALYEQKLLPELNEDFFISYIRTLAGENAKADYIDSLPVNKALSLYGQFPELLSRYEIYISKKIDQVLATLPVVVFDLESDGEAIREVAWITGTAIKTHKDFASLEEGLTALKTAFLSSTMIAGHNVKGYDLGVLEKHGFNTENLIVWDTYEMELLLQPDRDSYGLLTQHTAAADTKLTQALFFNQVTRLLCLDVQTVNGIRSLLSEPVQAMLDEVAGKFSFQGLDAGLLQQSSQQFFRPQPSLSVVPEEVSIELKTFLKKPGLSLVLAPELLWQPLSRAFPILVYDEDGPQGFLLSEEKINLQLADEPFLQRMLLRFIQLQNGKPALYAHLPAAIRILLGSQREMLVCNKIQLNDLPLDGSILLRPESLQQLRSAIMDRKDIQIIFVGSALHQLTTRYSIWPVISFATLFEQLKHDPIWLQMSGGRHAIPITRQQCERLGVNEFPAHAGNFWLEKTGRGKFQIRAAFDSAAFFQSVATDIVVQQVAWNVQTVPQPACQVVRPDTRKKEYIAEQKRVNPESLYRRLYWTYQFKILTGATILNPIVWLIQDPEEVTSLQSFARSKGYFVPDTNASLARQLELLQASKVHRRLLVASFKDWPSIIAANHAGSIDFVWDSLPLQEIYQLLGGRLPTEETAEVEDDFNTSRGEQSVATDLSALIRSCKPLISYYYTLIQQNHSDSRLLLLDPHFTDYFGIEQTFGAGSLQAAMWTHEEEYKAELAAASRFFEDAKSAEEIKFDVPEAKDILRQIFLAQDDPDKKPHQWRDYQHKCLDEILPGKKDLLISLPTGAGKSLLFQGPALFRSGFTNRLSIVITPLRALMEDQVAALWEKGFYNNVDYISGDKSQAEVRDIYRRTAGGELALLYITPERFRSKAFETALLTRLDADGGLEFAVFDEAHCISQWGQEFRPDYLNAGRKIADFSKPPVSYQMRKLLFSATISEQVFGEIQLLMPGIQPVAGTEKSYNPVREHIAIRFKHNIHPDLEKRLSEVAAYLKEGRFNPELSRALVFVKSRRQAEESALVMDDILHEVYGGSCAFVGKTAAFHAGMDAEDRKDAYEEFKSGDVVLLFATKAFGMGMDIPNIHFVTHLSPPGTFEDFLQEVGRAGRNEEERKKAGFDSSTNPIEAVCLTANSDFGKLKDQLLQSRIKWQEVSEIKQCIEAYISKFKPLAPDPAFPVAVPFNLYSVNKQSVEDEETRFRIGLYWLERLKRIRLGYFTITHLEFKAQLIRELPARLENFPDQAVEQVCRALVELAALRQMEGETIQLPVASIRSASKMPMEAMFSALIKAHQAGLIHLLQNVLVEPTKLRTDETAYCYRAFRHQEKYPALRIVFALAREILASVPGNESQTFDGDFLDQRLNEAIVASFYSPRLSWQGGLNTQNAEKEYKKYSKDVRKKRARHAFTLIRILGKTKVRSEITKQKDASRKIAVRQTVFNGYHKKEEWQKKMRTIEEDCIRLLDYVSQRFHEESQKVYNWADLLAALQIQPSLQHLGDLFFIISTLGYVRTNGLMPSGIEVYLESLDAINERDLQSEDKSVYETFEQTRKVRELKLIALQVLSGLEPKKQDSFIRRYFSCHSLESLLQLMETELPEDSPILKAFRAEAIEAEEKRLNAEQRAVYDAAIPQHISVLAGPGSGKTHTLTLRVARLVHHEGIPPDEILVLAYNRAVVSELKDRLARLFNNLGYDSLARRLKIFTFHGLAKKYCGEELEGQPFDQWERILLNKLQQSPGAMTNQMGAIRHILVDEFQDITQVRIELLDSIRQLSNAWMFIIGDPNQSIYGYDRKAEGGSMSPWPYYLQFAKRFAPTIFKLYKNHRSYPQILALASRVLDPSPEHQELLPKAIREPEAGFVKNYAETVDNIAQPGVKWEQQLSRLLKEKVNGKPYRQISVLFRTNNEVYRGYQKVRELGLSGVRIRIQGSLPYEFFRIREFAEVVAAIQRRSGHPLPENFRNSIGLYIQKLIADNPSWNVFYLRMLHALILDYVEETVEQQSFDGLIDFIEELTWRDDGQLYKLYEKYHDTVAGSSNETEIVLTTMHKVKGLEFDAVVIPPSFADLPLTGTGALNATELLEQIEEEKRLAFVAYTRARYRLIAFTYYRERALGRRESYQFPQSIRTNLGIPVKPELQKLYISWGATANGYNVQIQEYIRSNVRSGDSIEINGGYVYHNGNRIGKLSQGAFGRMPNGNRITGFVANEVVVWSYDDTLKSDQRNKSNFASSWCEQAKNKGLIYLVDFAGYGQAQ